MKISFGESLRRLRIQQGLSQQRLAEAIHVDRSSVARWETDQRLPNLDCILRLSDCLGSNVGELFVASQSVSLKPNIIIVDDEKIILNGGIPVIKEVMPYASVTGFTAPSAALEYARKNRVALAFLDIEMGHISGLDVCAELLKIDPRTNVVYLTAYKEYSFDAWETGACGFLLKPIDADKIRDQLKKLRYTIGVTE